MIEVKWIKGSDGTEYPIRFNMTVYYQLAKEYKVATNNIVKFLNSFASWDIDQTYKLYFYALQSGARKEGKVFEKTELEFIDWLFDDDNLLKQIEQIFIDSFIEGDGSGAKSKKPKAEK